MMFESMLYQPTTLFATTAAGKELDSCAVVDLSESGVLHYGSDAYEQQNFQVADVFKEKDNSRW